MNYEDKDILEASQNIEWDKINPEWTQDNNPMIELLSKNKEINDLEKFTMMLMKVIISNVDFRTEAIKILKEMKEENKENDLERISFFIKMKYPMIQGLDTHILFRKCAKFVDKDEKKLKTSHILQSFHDKYASQIDTTEIEKKQK